MQVKPLIFTAALLFNGLALAGNPMAGLFEAYQRMQSALASDDFAAAKTAAAKLSQAAGTQKDNQGPADLSTVWEAQAPALKAAAKDAGEAADIATLRNHFARISEAMIAVARVAHPQGQGEYHCPMAFNNKGANWLQPEGAVHNPYFGAAMLACGYRTDGKQDK